MRVETLGIHRDRLENKSSGLEKEIFLKILIAQMKYQNPLQPVKPDEFLNQLSLITQVEKLANISSSIEKLLALHETKGIYDSSSLIGKKVNSDGATLTEGDEVHLKPEGEFERIVILLTNERTGEKREVIIEKGESPIFRYDGKEEVKVSVFGIKGKESRPVKFDVMRIVKGIEFQDGKLKLVLGCGRTVGIEEVKRVIS